VISHRCTVVSCPVQVTEGESAARQVLRGSRVMPLLELTVTARDETPIIFDLGSGLRPLGLELDAQRKGSAIDISAFLSHLHWDHIIGLPFFTTAHDPLTNLEIYGPPQGGGSLHDLFDRVLHPPFFPVNVEQLRGSIHFNEVLDQEVTVGSAKVMVRQVPHVGTTLGFRVESEGVSIAFVSDHQQPADQSFVDRNVLELCEGVDLLIHDAQYTPEEFVMKSDWGHSTIAYAVHVAHEAGARELCLFHHDPLHSDDDIDRLLGEARSMKEASTLHSVIAASEGLSVDVTKSLVPIGSGGRG
jgi:ribonuclease BN (tRNA processing enzyme)